VRRASLSLVRTALPLFVIAVMPWAVPTSAAPRIEVSRHVNFEVVFSLINASPAPGTEAADLSVIARPREPGKTEFGLLWPDQDSACRLKLSVSHGQPSGRQTHAALIDAELTLAGGSKVRSSRRMEFDDSQTSLFEVYRVGERSLTLVIELRAEEETVVSRRRTVGAPVRFMVEIQRVAAGRSVTLETDFLQTFVGDPVSYSFSLGAAPDADSVHLTLKPMRISGSLLEVEVDTSGTLPGEGGPLLLGRRENLIASQGAVSTLSFESGDPPTGYRFLVTADF